MPGEAHRAGPREDGLELVIDPGAEDLIDRREPVRLAQHRGGQALGATGGPVELFWFFRSFTMGVGYGSTPGRSTRDGRERIVTGVGTAGGSHLTVSPDETWSYGGRRGRWARTGNAEHPIVLQGFERGKPFVIGTAAVRPGEPAREVILTDFNTHFRGRPDR